MSANGHRQKGSGDQTIRVVPRTDQGGVRLFIGRALHQGIGEPRRVDLAPCYGKLCIVPGTRYAVVGSGSNTQPRITVGVAACEELGIDPDLPIRYAAQVDYPRIIVHTDSAYEQLSGEAFAARRKALELSQPALAAQLGVRPRTVARWERAGTRLSMAQYQTLIRLAAESPANRI